MTAADRPSCVNGCGRPAHHLTGKRAGQCKACVSKDDRAAAKASGKCTGCKARPAEPGRTRCAACRTRQRTATAAYVASGIDAANKRRARDAWKVAGLCFMAAGHGPATHGVYCSACATARDARRVRKAEAFWAAHGIDAWTCWLCCLPIADGNRHIEHVVPRDPRHHESKGSDLPSNLRPAHTACNLAKSDDDPWPYLVSVWDDLGPEEVHYL
ncbi:HNH endonuclease [Micromonospora ureilytica]|uniref:5-methylcytosine-specific restriction endonuclease McrA n=1 Tax=Micromonospora ureilytica TaxID=709868 RepID=A0ABS0JLD1_9ACTN|nr:hypothetical protein [Micromonospora ureilytica]MBG6067862.1 5-methylcytosine-specific restriction endonuclease McrA [Micromonospora ureilytica]